jgi:hypothetical protein
MKYVFWTLELLDIWTTHLGFLRGYVEANPIMRVLFQHGELAGYGFKLLVVALVSLIIIRKYSAQAQVWLFGMGAGLVLMAVVSNLLRLYVVP